MMRWAAISRLGIIYLVPFALLSSAAEGASYVPSFRFSIGYSMLKLTAGEAIENESISSLVSLSPSFLWDFPKLNARFGPHFQMDLMGKYGTLPIAGIGVTVLYYPLGISSSYDVQHGGTMIQKSRVSPYFIGALTPAKVSISEEATDELDDPLVFSAVIIEPAFGAGVDYPLRENLILHASVIYRVGSFVAEKGAVSSIEYGGPALYLGFTTTYY